MVNTKLTFIVERRTGKMPDVFWNKVFEREVDVTHCSSPLFDIIECLHILFQGDQFRVVVYA